MDPKIVFAVFILISVFNQVDSACQEIKSCESCLLQNCKFVKSRKDLICVEKIHPSMGIRKIFTLMDCHKLSETAKTVSTTQASKPETTTVAFRSFPQTEIPTPQLESTTTFEKNGVRGSMDQIPVETDNELLVKTLDAEEVPTSSPVTAPLPQNGSINSDTALQCLKPLCNVTLDSIGATVKYGRIYLDGVPTRFKMHYNERLILRLMKSFCNIFILTQRHVRVGKESAKAFLKSVANNPMRNSSRACSILTGRERESSVVETNFTIHDPAPPKIVAFSYFKSSGSKGMSLHLTLLLVNWLVYI